MGGRGLVAAGDIDNELATALLANSERFLPGAVATDPGDPPETCYALAIATELALKAFLLAHGWSDDRCRCDVRHDLKKALAYAEEAGLTAIPGLEGLVAVLNDYHPTHVFDSFVPPRGDARFAMRARQIVADLIDDVRITVEAIGG